SLIEMRGGATAAHLAARALVHPGQRACRVARPATCALPQSRGMAIAPLRPASHSPRYQRSHAMADPNKEAISVLNPLVATSETGADAVKDVRYKDLLRRNSEQRCRFVSELQAEVQRLGGKPEDRGTAAGAMHRGWIELRTAISSKDEKAVLAECERGEDHAV